MKHVRLMIFCNWISKKAGDKVPHTPLILPISTAGPKACSSSQMTVVEGKRKGNEARKERRDRGVAWTAPRLHKDGQPLKARQRVLTNTVQSPSLCRE